MAVIKAMRCASESAVIARRRRSTCKELANEIRDAIRTRASTTLQCFIRRLLAGAETRRRRELKKALGIAAMVRRKKAEKEAKKAEKLARKEAELAAKTPVKRATPPMAIWQRENKDTISAQVKADTSGDKYMVIVGRIWKNLADDTQTRYKQQSKAEKEALEAASATA